MASYPRAVKEELGKDTEYDVCPHNTNPVEQSHRRIKHRYCPILGFGEFDAAKSSCRTADEVELLEAAITNLRIRVPAIYRERLEQEVLSGIGLTFRE